FAQESTIQFPKLDFHMQMNQKLSPSISYRAQTDIVVGDQSGLIFGIGVAGDNLNLQSGLNDLITLDTIKLSINPSTRFNFHTFFGRHKYLGEDRVIPRGFQFNYTPGFNYYGYRAITGAGVSFTFPIQDGRYEPELMLYSDNINGLDFFNADFLTTFRFERWYMELYAGVAAPTIGSFDSKVRVRAGLSINSALEYANVYFTVYLPAHYGDQLTADDLYIRFSQHLLINGFEQSFSVTSLGSESENFADPIVGLNNIPDLNIFLSLGGRINNIGFGVDYGFIYGLHESEFRVDNLAHFNNRFGAYVDFTFLTLTYKFGIFYSLPDSPLYIQKAGPSAGDLGLYVSVYGAT
ncbi:MAG: hypothetical protein ACRCV0_07950, partial [Brevinema sp.]